MSHHILQGRQFHHYTDFAGASGITAEGPRASEYGSHGAGLYLSPDADRFTDYVSSSKGGGTFRLSGPVAASNPYVTTGREYQRAALLHSHPDIHPDSDEAADIMYDDEAMDEVDRKFQEHLKSLGHDSIYSKTGFGDELILFHPKDFEFNSVTEH